MARQLMFMPQWDPNAESLVTGPSQDDHDGGPAAGVASGFDPSGGEPCYQFGNQWVCSIVVSEAVTVSCELGLVCYRRICCLLHGVSLYVQPFRFECMLIRICGDDSYIALVYTGSLNVPEWRTRESDAGCHLL